MPVASSFNVLWTGACFDPSGYGEASRGYLKALHKLGCNIRLKPKYFYGGSLPTLSPEDIAIYKQIANTPLVPGPIISIQHLTPENYEASEHIDYHIGMTTFETDSTPKGWQLPMRAMDEIITFSQFNKQVFESTGIKKVITVIPHGVDTGCFNPDATPLNIPQLEAYKDRAFIFGSNFDWTARKNPEALIRAYYSAFKNSHRDVLLVLKVYSQSGGTAVIASKIQAIAASMDLGPLKPDIILVDGILSQQEMAGFYNCLDCYILPSRGEGWSLSHSEAMACGKLTVGVNWSGNTEFMNESNSILLNDFKLTEIDARQDIPKHYVGHKWADVDVGDLGAAMCMAKMFKSDPACKAMTDQARKDMCEKFTWDLAGQKLYDRLTTIASGITKSRRIKSTESLSA